MELMEAIKTCADAGVTVQCYVSMPAEVYIEHEDFLKEFKSYFIKELSTDEDDVLYLLSEEKDGIIFKAYIWKSELEAGANA